MISQYSFTSTELSLVPVTKATISLRDGILPAAIYSCSQNIQGSRIANAGEIKWIYFLTDVETQIHS